MTLPISGEIVPVAGGEMDFRVARKVEPGSPLFDNCFCLGDGPGPLREVLRLSGQSGIGMSVSTTEAGVQVYDGRNAYRPGRGPHEGLAIEAQGWPDAPNHAGFPPIDLSPGRAVFCEPDDAIVEYSGRGTLVVARGENRD